MRMKEVLSVLRCPHFPQIDRWSGTRSKLLGVSFIFFIESESTVAVPSTSKRTQTLELYGGFVHGSI
jgi:hypothetical protein